jgi:uncharacterized protein (DUF58 family)
VLTREGWLVAVGAAALIVVGRFLGAFELYLLGAGIAALVIVALLAVVLTRLRVGVSRALVPPRVHAGSPARVELRMANHASHRTPVLRLRDAVTGTRGANLLLSPLAPGEATRAAYQLPTDRRGVLKVGPLEVIVADPFGLSQSRTSALGTSQLIVYPRIDQIAPIALASAHDPQATARHPNAVGRVGDDFYALRPYVVGDDLRKVHWPSTARLGELVVRQHELPWQERTTVMLDVRSYSHTAASFELAVSAAASILVACFGRGDQVRLFTSDRVDSGFGNGRSHLDALLDHLAVVQLDQAASIQASFDELGRVSGGGSLVLVVAALSSNDLVRFAGLRKRYGHVVTVMFEPSSYDPDGVDQAAPIGVQKLLRVTRSSPFAEVWNRHNARAPLQEPARA